MILRKSIKSFNKSMKNFFSAKIEQFLEYLAHMRGYSSNTIYTYRLNLQEAIEFVGFEQEDEVYHVNLTPYRTHIADKNKKTIYKKVTIFRSFVHFLQEQGFIITIIGDDAIKLPKTLPKPISNKYIKEALSKCDIQERLIIVLIYGLGLRISELANLKNSDISTGWVRIKGKGDKIRELPVLYNLEEALKHYFDAYPSKVYVFEKEGKRLNENQLRYQVGKIFKRIGLRVTPHQLRHAFATDLLNEGARITDVSELLGHSALSTTEIYTKLSTSYKLDNYRAAHPLCKETDEFSKEN